MSILFWKLSKTLWITLSYKIICSFLKALQSNSYIILVLFQLKHWIIWILGLVKGNIMFVKLLTWSQKRLRKTKIFCWTFEATWQTIASNYQDKSDEKTSNRSTIFIHLFLSIMQYYLEYKIAKIKQKIMKISRPKQQKCRPCLRVIYGPLKKFCNICSIFVG